MTEDPFVILGVGEDASDKNVQSVFRKLALHCHPDRHPKDPLAKVRFLRISRAKDTLLDPAKRRTALCQHRNRCQQRQPARSAGQKSEDARSQARRCAEKQRLDAAQRRRAAAEQMRKREREAEARKRQAFELRAHCERLHAEKEAAAQEKAARMEQHKANMFDAFLRRKQAKAAAKHNEEVPSVLAALVRRFATSSEQILAVPGPLGAAEYSELQAAVQSHGLRIVRENGSYSVHRAKERSDSDSPWEPSGGTNIDKKAKRLGKRVHRSAGAKENATERHRKALESLHARRANGEGLTRTPQGSWWVPDVEAERYSKYIGPFGF